MATRKKISSYLGQSNYLNLTQPNIPDDDTRLFEFDESEVWNFASSDQSQTKKSIPSSRPSKKLVGSKKIEKMDRTVSSLPVNIPDWSKILGGDHGRVMAKADYQYGDQDHQSEDDDDEADDKFPPHVYLARTRGASFSVHEGRGRTLKGRDLRRVRNAIWKKTGFED